MSISEFSPFGATMDAKGTVAAVGGSTGEEHPRSQEIIDLLKAAFRCDGKSGKIRACALTYDIRIVLPEQKDKTDAVAIDLDHRSGMSVVMVYPYRIIAGKKDVVGEPFAQEGQAEIFRGSQRRRKHQARISTVAVVRQVLQARLSMSSPAGSATGASPAISSSVR